jgi:hypothetical protein
MSREERIIMTRNSGVVVAAALWELGREDEAL